MIYLASCALIKLLVPEPGTHELRTLLTSRAAEGHVTSAIAQTEIARALVRTDAAPEIADAAEDLLDRVLRLRVTDSVLRTAGLLPARHLRTLDAIHVASAEQLEAALTAFVTYDKRLAAVAQDRGLPVSSPGGDL